MGIWSSIRERALALKPCRVPILLVLAGLVFLFVGQGQDVVRALAERRAGKVDTSQIFWFVAASIVWALSAWYWARVMLFLRFDGVPEHKPHLQRWRTWTPRALGLVALAGLALAFYRASLGYAPAEYPEVKDLLQFYAGAWLAGAIVFFVTVWARRPVSRGVYAGVRRAAAAVLKDEHKVQKALERPVIAALNLPKESEQRYGELKLSDLSAETWSVLGAVLVGSLTLFAIMVAAPHWAAPAMGSAAILLAAAAAWIAAGSTLDVIGMRARFPVFTALLVWAVACSYWNDNHAVRTLADAQPERQSLRASLRSWLERHEDKLARGKEKIPLYLVNAEGGGIRAAYWTVSVLGQIQADNPCFADHLYSLSGVSGGSLGASIFVALLAEAPLSAPCDAPAVNRTLDIKETAQRILSEDFLAPVVGAMLYPDLAQRFWPLPIESFDRAATLEEAWEKAWARHVPGSRRMSEPMDRLWADPRPKQWLPALFLNATWVETGKRIIASNVRIANPRRRSEDFVDSEDANAFFAPRSLALSTAAHMSARFTYVSPAGTLVRNGETHGRVVDGGYFENSGATATLEILQTIDAMAERDPRWKRVEPIVIHISNDPVDAKYGSDSLLGAHQNPYVAPADILHEVLSPLWTLLNTRDARGYHARESVMWHVWPNFLHFGLCRRSSNVPLGWVLSQSTQQRMEAQLAGSCGVAGAAGSFDNAGNLRRIGARLGREAGV